MLSMSSRLECLRCGRPQVTCYCAHLPTLETRSRVLVLQHPREEDKAIGTARMASLCLPQSKVAVGVDFSAAREVQTWLGDARFPAALLYPTEGAIDLAEAPPAHPVTLVVIDGTWHQARALLRKNPQLLKLPRYAFRPERPSEYRIRREPRADYVSTIEALALALGALEGDAARFEALLVPFRAMVDKQLTYAVLSPRGRHRLRRRNLASTPACLPPWLSEPNLV
jgi:DTW domain-containing protein YfiP